MFWNYVSAFLFLGLINAQSVQAHTQQAVKGEDRVQTASVVPSIIDRLDPKSPRGEESNWWPLWMDSYALPVFLTAHEAGIFDALCKVPNQPKTEAQVSQSAKITARTARVLLGQLEALKFVKRVNGNVLLTDSSKAECQKKAWKPSIEKMKLYAADQNRYLEALKGNTNAHDPWNLKLEDKQLDQLFEKSMTFPALAAADKLGLFDKMPLTVDQIISSIQKDNPKASETAIRSMLSTLTAHSVLRKDIASGKYFLRPEVAPYLQKKSPFYKGGTFELMAAAPASFKQSWEALEKDRKKAAGKSTVPTMMDEHTAEARHRAEVFARHMDAQGAGADLVAAQTMFRPGDKIVDVGGGGGSYAILGAALQKAANGTPGAKFLVTEKGEMANVAKTWVSKFGEVAGQVEVAERDMFKRADWQSIQSSFAPNKIFLSNVVHDWGLEKGKQIVDLAYESLPEGGQVILHEMPLDDAKGRISPVAAAFSETLRIWTEGNQYKRGELAKLVSADSRFKVQMVKGAGPYWFFVGTKVSTKPSANNQLARRP